MNTVNLILTIIGILVSGFGLYYAIKQVKGLQKITEQYQEQVKLEVTTAQEKIRNGLLISEVTLCLKNLESAIKYIQESKIELFSILYKFSTCLKIRRVFVREAIFPQHFHNNFNLCETGGKKDYRRVS